MKADDTYIYYSSMGKNIRILKTDIESVSIDADDKPGIGHIGYNCPRINGKGTLLGEVYVTSGFARNAQDFILEEIKDNPKPNQSGTSNLDEIEKLASLKGRHTEFCGKGMLDRLASVQLHKIRYGVKNLMQRKNSF